MQFWEKLFRTSPEEQALEVGRLLNELDIDREQQIRPFLREYGPKEHEPERRFISEEVREGTRELQHGYVINFYKESGDDNSVARAERLIDRLKGHYGDQLSAELNTAPELDTDWSKPVGASVELFVAPELAVAFRHALVPSENKGRTR